MVYIITFLQDAYTHTHTKPKNLLFFPSASTFNIFSFFLEMIGTKQIFLNCMTLSWINGEGNSTSLQYSCLENSMDGGAW